MAGCPFPPFTGPGFPADAGGFPSAPAAEPPLAVPERAAEPFSGPSAACDVAGRPPGA
jgi:hypothetical protein